MQLAGRACRRSGSAAAAASRPGARGSPAAPRARPAGRRGGGSRSGRRARRAGRSSTACTSGSPSSSRGGLVGVHDPALRRPGRSPPRRASRGCRRAAAAAAVSRLTSCALASARPARPTSSSANASSAGAVAAARRARRRAPSEPSGPPLARAAAPSSSAAATSPCAAVLLVVDHRLAQRRGQLRELGALAAQRARGGGELGALRRRRAPSATSSSSAHRPSGRRVDRGPVSDRRATPLRQPPQRLVDVGAPSVIRAASASRCSWRRASSMPRRAAPRPGARARAHTAIAAPATTVMSGRRSRCAPNGDAAPERTAMTADDRRTSPDRRERRGDAARPATIATRRRCRTQRDGRRRSSYQVRPNVDAGEDVERARATSSAPSAPSQRTGCGATPRAVVCRRARVGSRVTVSSAQVLPGGFELRSSRGCRGSARSTRSRSRSAPPRSPSARSRRSPSSTRSSWRCG